MAKAVAYSGDRHRFGLVYGWAEVLVGLAFLAAGGLGAVEAAARRAAGALGLGTIATGLAFFAILGLLTSAFDLPFDLHATFRIEEKHGFNRQTLRGFFLDRLKGAAVAVALGGPVLAAVLWLMERMGPSWWLWAWGVTTAFSLFAAWIYPTVLAPLFNKFTPLPEGELKEAILALARRTGFEAGGISVMDASRRTAHGNAYFTGVFGQKRIVLFDTLLEAMGPREVVAVLAHELGHFKLHHVRWGLLRGIATSGLVFYLLSLCLPLDAFYAAFSVERTSYGALAVFGLWFGLASFLLQPARRTPSPAGTSSRPTPSPCARARRRPSSGRRSGSSARRAGTCRSPTRSTRASTTRIRRSSSGCGRWGRSRAPERGSAEEGPGLFLEGEDRVLHAVFVGAEAQDADPERVAAADAGAGEEDPPARVDAAQELGERRSASASPARSRKATTESCGSSSTSNRGSSRSISYAHRARASFSASCSRKAETPWRTRGSHSRSPRKSRESSGERSAKPSEPSSATSWT